MKFFIFATIFSAVFILMKLYIYKRLINKLHFSNRVKLYLNIFLVVNFIGIIGYLLGRYTISIPNSLYFFLSLPIGVLFLMFVLALLYELGNLLIRVVPLDDKRRILFRKSIDYISVASIFGLSAKAIYNARNIVVKESKIELQKLQKSYKIVQLSDIHIGGLIDREFISELVLKVNKLKPDVVVLTGDIIDTKVSYVESAIDELGGIKAQFGTYFVVGNHEYFHNIGEIIRKVKSLGINVLENSSVLIDGGFNLAGVYDIFGYRIDELKPDLNRALQNRDENLPTILLAHQPRYVDEVDDRVDLMLSGHTHGGQIFPFRFLVKLQQPYISGHYHHNDKLQIYVNTGTGFWGPPMRLLTKSEISLIEIVPS